MLVLPLIIRDQSILHYGKMCGKVDVNETSRQAAIRYLREQTGLVADKATYIMTGFYMDEPVNIFKCHVANTGKWQFTPFKDYSHMDIFDILFEVMQC